MASVRAGQFTTARFALVLLVLVTVGYVDVVAGWRSFYTRDFSTFGYPLAQHVRESYRDGVIPLWNPYNYAGLPFLAQWNTMALYPPSLFYVLLPLPWSLNCFNLAHLYFGGIGMFVLARRWWGCSDAAAVAGTAYAFGGLMTSALMWPNNIAALGWLPWVWHAGEIAIREGGRRKLALAMMVLGFQCLTGAPEVTSLSWSCLALAALFGAGPPGAIPLLPRCQRLAGLGLGALCLSAAQLLPFLELLAMSHRDTGYARGDWSLAWDGFGNLLVPLFRTIKDRDGIFFQPNQQWVTTYYPCGIIVVLAVYQLVSNPTGRTRLLGILAAGSVVLALGSYGGVYPLVLKLFPVLGVMRYPIKFIVPMLAILPLLAAGALAAVADAPRPNKTIARVGFLAILLAGSLLVWNIAAPRSAENHAEVLRSGIVSIAAMGIVVVWLWLRLENSRRLPSWALPALVISVVFGDLITANRHANPVVAPEFLARQVAELQPRPKLGMGRALANVEALERLHATIFTTPEAAASIPRSGLALSTSLAERVPVLGGFFSLYLRSPLPVLWFATTNRASEAQGLLDFLGVSHLQSARRPWEWSLRPGQHSWIALVPNARPLPANALPEQLFDSSFRPREWVWIDGVAESEMSAAARAGGSVKVLEFSAGVIEAMADVSGPSSSWLTIAQAYHPGWRAEVDGRPVPVAKANLTFQAVQVPPGRHSVRLQFRSVWFDCGCVISGLSLILCVVASVYPKTPSRPIES